MSYMLYWQGLATEEEMLEFPQRKDHTQPINVFLKLGAIYYSARRRDAYRAIRATLTEPERMLLGRARLLCDWRFRYEAVLRD
jgi:hypothetical protein